MDGVAFRFEDVDVDRGGRRVLTEVSAELPDHGITVIVGPSGSGKSTLLRLCNRLLVPTAGTVTYRGDDLAGLDPLALRRRVGMVFQRPVTLPGTVADNLREADPDADEARVATALDRVGLDGFGDRPADELSGGQTQRMALARTLMAHPEFVLFDEPTSSLDPAAATGIEQLAVALEDTGTPSAWVTHDLDQMRRLAHHVIVLVDGRVHQQGDLDEVLANPSPSVAEFLGGIR